MASPQANERARKAADSLFHVNLFCPGGATPDYNLDGFVYGVGAGWGWDRYEACAVPQLGLGREDSDCPFKSRLRDSVGT